jgi:hypothetical protein
MTVSGSLQGHQKQQMYWEGALLVGSVLLGGTFAKLPDPPGLCRWPFQNQDFKIGAPKSRQGCIPWNLQSTPAWWVPEPMGWNPMELFLSPRAFQTLPKFHLQFISLTWTVSLS